MNTPAMVFTTDIIVRTISMTMNIITVLLLLFVAVRTKVIAIVIVSAGAETPKTYAWRTPLDVACMPRLTLFGRAFAGQEKELRIPCIAFLTTWSWATREVNVHPLATASMSDYNIVCVRMHLNARGPMSGSLYRSCACASDACCIPMIWRAFMVGRADRCY